MTLGWIAVVAAGVWWLTTRLRAEVLPDWGGTSTESGAEVRKTNPYLIRSMRERSYDSQIEIERRVRETGGFVSYVVSFFSDGLEEYALMNVPNPSAGSGQGMPDNGWPVVVVNHGYIEPEVYSVENSYINTSAYFANAGFLVVKPDYRGHDKSEGEAGSLTSRINYAVDVMNLLAGVRKLDNADESRIYMYGHSMGGDVTLRVLEVCPNCVQAATLWAPAVRDFPESYMYFARRNADTPARRERRERFQRELAMLFTPQEYEQVSAFDNVNLVEAPVNIHHGTNDESVPYEWGQMVVGRFVENNKEHYFYSYPGDNHVIAGNWSTALNRDIELFQDN